MNIDTVINTGKHPISTSAFRFQCKQILDDAGVLVLPDFLSLNALDSIQQEGEDNQYLAYYTSDNHNIYLQPPDPELPSHHVRNREVCSSKGCITTDQVPVTSSLQTLYNSIQFREFLCAVLGEKQLYEYADALSSVNIHYASEGQELGWHYDNSSFAITLMIQPPESGGIFEYVKDVRNADCGEMNYELTRQVLDGEVSVQSLRLEAGSLVLFRGRNSIHRVTPTEGNTTRMLAVLAYNTEPNISLSESARMTFYGRLK